MWSVDNVSKLNDKITNFWKADDQFLFYINHYFDNINWLLNNIVRNFDFYIDKTSYKSNWDNDSMIICVFLKWRFLKTIEFTSKEYRVQTIFWPHRPYLQNNSSVYNKFFEILSLLESSDNSFLCLPDEIHIRWWSLIDFSWIEVYKKVWGNENFYKEVIRTYKIDGDYAYHSKNIIYSYMTNSIIFLRKDDYFYSEQVISDADEYKQFLIWQSHEYINNLSLPLVFINNKTDKDKEKNYQVVYFRDFFIKTFDILKDYNLRYSDLLSIRNDTDKINNTIENGFLLNLTSFTSGFFQTSRIHIPDDLVERLQEIWWIKLERERSGVISFFFLYDYKNYMVMKTNLENVSSPYIFKNNLFVKENWKINIYRKTINWTLELEEENFLYNDDLDFFSSYKETNNYLFCFWKQKFIILNKETGEALFTIDYETEDNKQLLLSFLNWDIDIKEDQWKNIIVIFWDSNNILYFDIKLKTFKNIILWEKTFSFFKKKINKWHELVLFSPNKIGYKFKLGSENTNETFIGSWIWFSYNHLHFLESQNNIEVSKYKEIFKVRFIRYTKDPLPETDLVIYQIWMQWINNIVNIKNYGNENITNLLGEDQLFIHLSSNLFSSSSIVDFYWFDKYLSLLISWNKEIKANNRQRVDGYGERIYWLKSKLIHAPYEHNPSYSISLIALKQNNYKFVYLLDKN